MVTREILEVGRVIHIGETRIRVISIIGEEVQFGIEAPSHLLVAYSREGHVPEPEVLQER